MKNALLKFAGLFVERIPPEEPGGNTHGGHGEYPGHSHGNSGAHAAPVNQFPTGGAPTIGATPASSMHGMQNQLGTAMVGQPLHMHGPPPRGPNAARSGASTGDSGSVNQPVAVALRAWVPETYAAILAAHGMHVVAAGGALSSDQARTWGAQALLISMECLGSDTHLLTSPAMATVFIAHQPMMVADTPGLVQVSEPIRASELAAATRAALADWNRVHV